MIPSNDFLFTVDHCNKNVGKNKNLCLLYKRSFMSANSPCFTHHTIRLMAVKLRKGWRSHTVRNRSTVQFYTLTFFVSGNIFMQGIRRVLSKCNNFLSMKSLVEKEDIKTFYHRYPKWHFYATEKFCFIFTWAIRQGCSLQQFKGYSKSKNWSV